MADALDDTHKVVFEVADSLTLPESVGENVWIIDKVCVMDIIDVWELSPVSVNVVNLLNTEVIEDFILNVAIFDATEEEVTELLAVDDIDFADETDISGLFDKITDADVDAVDNNDVIDEVETETLAEWVTRLVNVLNTVKNAELDESGVRVKIADNDDIAEWEGTERVAWDDELELPLTREDFDSDGDTEGECESTDESDTCPLLEIEFVFESVLCVVRVEISDMIDEALGQIVGVNDTLEVRDNNEDEDAVIVTTGDKVPPSLLFIDTDASAVIDSCIDRVALDDTVR